MMFLVIFGSLAAAMAIVSQGNLATADSQMKISRSLAGAETGMNLVIHRLNEISQTVVTTYGLIDGNRADELWLDPNVGVRQALYTAFSNEFHNLAEPVLTARGLQLGPIAIGSGAPTFTATLEPHPLAGPGGAGDYSRYDDPFYQRAPYNDPDLFDQPISSTNPLDARWVRILVTATDGQGEHQIGRTISMDFRIDKKLRYAIISKSRVMIGRNVMIEGQIGSRFLETNLTNGHPVQMESDFRGLSSALDAQLDVFINTLATNDVNGDNRLNLANSAEINGITDPEQYDVNGDNYVDDYDFFLTEFDNNGDGRLSAIELDTAGDINRAQLLELIDTFGDSTRAGYNDGFIDEDDRYAKVRGKVLITADMQGWLDGAGGGVYQDYFQGPIHPDYTDPPLTFEAPDNDVYQFDPASFDVDSFRNMADGDLATAAAAQFADHDPSDPASPNMDLSGSVHEAVPFGAAHPYDYYDRPVYENMTFQDVKIPKGTNALFKNCTFIGVTFVETETDNTDPNYNYAGMQEADGSQKHPDKTAVVGGVEVADTKTVSNNLRFDGCTFEGAIVSDAPQEFTHTRNKVAFTGTTQFKINESTHLSDSEKTLFRRSTLLVPQYSVEMGTFISPYDSAETVELSGTIVAGLVDMRGQIKINGSLITTFEPVSNTGPVLGETSPQFNTTLGYFSSTAGDLEAEVPGNGIGVIQIRYDPTLPMPDGITGPIEVKKVVASYFEGVAP